jgi:hypothetical protein
MKKILLIEDRTDRQKDFLDKLDISLDDYSDILNNKIDDKFKECIENIKNDNFDFGLYDVIIAHESIFIDDNRTILSKIENYCKESHKPLILFSGGNSADSFDNSQYQKLTLNSQTLYSQNITIFFDEFKKDNNDIFILQFGTKWRVNILLNGFEILNNFIKENDKERVLLNRFKSYNSEFLNKISSLNIELYDYQIEKNKIYMSEIIKLKDDIYSHIEAMADE